MSVVKEKEKIMLKLIVGEKGSGKTEVLMEKANELVETSKGNIVYIDHDNSLMYELKHSVRFVNVKDFPIENVDEFIGFLSGIISNDYDIKCFFIDGLFKVMNAELSDIGEVIPRIERLSEMFNMDFYITVSAQKLDPEYDKYVL